MWFLAIVAFALLYRRLDGIPARRRFWRGYLTAFTLFIFSLAWTRQFSAPGWLLLSAFEAVFFGLSAVAVMPGRFRVLTFPSAFTLGEAARHIFPWGGLPMGGVTTGQASGLLAPSVTIVGELGLVTLMSAAGAGIVELLRSRSLRNPSVCVPFGICIAVSVWGAQVKFEPQTSLRVATVQAGGEQGLLRFQQRPAEVFRSHFEITERMQDQVDLIVWPENVVSLRGPLAGSNADAEMARLAQEKKATIAAGVVETEGSRFRNSVVTWSPAGEVTSKYEKVQRVPFGEYVPHRALFNRFADLSEVPRDAFAGRGPAVVLAGKTKLGVAVSYEGLFSRRLRSAVRSGGEALIVPTNASSYKSSHVAEEQVQAARLRARETRRWVVQSAPTGLSVLVDPHGSVKASSEIGPPAVLTSTIELSKTKTPFTHFGSWPVLVFSAVALLFAAVHAIRRRRENSGGQA